MDSADRKRISDYITQNEDNIKYHYSKSLDLHETKVENNGKFVAIQKHTDKTGKTDLKFRCNLCENKKCILTSEQQSFFDRLFIRGIFSKMFEIYTEKNKTTR